MAMTEMNKIQISHPLTVFICMGPLESHNLDDSNVIKTQSPENKAKRQSETAK